MKAHPTQDPIKVAHHEAGHVVAAAEFGITVRKVAILRIADEPPGARLLSLGKFTEIAKSPSSVVQLVEQYAVARLAGPISEMIFAAYKWQAARHTVSWPRWRKRWQKQLTENDDSDIDYAIAAAFAWSNCRTSVELSKRFDELWLRTENLLRRPDTWKKVGRLAAVLLERGVLTGAEALRWIESSDAV